MRDVEPSPIEPTGQSLRALDVEHAAPGLVNNLDPKSSQLVRIRGLRRRGEGEDAVRYAESGRIACLDKQQGLYAAPAEMRQDQGDADHLHYGFSPRQQA